MKFYLFGTMRTCFLMQLVLLAVFFISVPAVRADIITFRYEGELTSVDAPLEGQFSVGDSFRGTYTFKSDTTFVITDYYYGEDIADDYYFLDVYPNVIKALYFSSGTYMAATESGDIETYEDDVATDYSANFNSVEGLSVGGYIPQEISFAVYDNDYNTFGKELNFSSNLIHPEYQNGSMGFAFEEVGSQNPSYLRGDIFSVSLLSRISTTIVPNNKWLQIGLKTAPPVGSTVADIIGDDISAPYGSEWVVYRASCKTNKSEEYS